MAQALAGAGDWVISAAAVSVTPFDILFAVVGSGGVLSAFVALYKLRPDVNTASVTQAQGAAAALALANRQIVADRDEWRQRAREAEAERRDLLGRLEECERAHGRRRADS